MVFTRFGSGYQSRQLQASKASFLAGSESDVRHWHRGLGSAVGTGMPWCFPFRKRPPKQSAAGSESDVRQWHRGFGMRRLGPACHGVFPFRKRPPKPSAAGSESDVRQWHRGFGSAVGTGMPWYVFTRFGSGRQSRQLQASKASFLAGSSDVRQWHRGLGSAVGPACHGVYPFRKRPPKPSAAGFKG